MVETNTLNELSHHARQLNQKTDDLNQSIKVLNDQLGEMNIGLEYWLENTSYTGNQDPRVLKEAVPPQNFRDENPMSRLKKYFYLGYCKLENEWQLAVKEDIVTEQDDETIPDFHDVIYTPLLKASRELRLLAAERFDQLLEGLNEMVKSKLKVLEHAATLAKERSE